MTTENLYADMSNAINGDEYRVRDTIQDSFRREHRTLQQSYVRTFIVPVLRVLVEDYENGYYDARNEDSCKFAKAALEATKDIYLPLI